MANTIPEEVMQLFRDRRALLWVCQRHELLPDEEPHPYDLRETEAALLYRPEPDQTDRAIASLYWEAIWLEGAKSLVLRAMQQSAENQPSLARRGLVLLASEADAQARVSSTEFLPVCVLPGLLDFNISAAARYGAVKLRQRKKIAWSLKERIEKLPGRVLIVLGAQHNGDLAELYEVLEDAKVVNLALLVVWPGDKAPPLSPDNPLITRYTWTGATADFIATLKGDHAPSAADLPRWTIRAGKTTLQLQAGDIDRIFERFVLLTEQDTTPQDRFTMGDLQAFLAGSLTNWVAFSAGLPVERAYASGAGKTLYEEVRDGLRTLSERGGSEEGGNQKGVGGESGPPLTFVIQIPCDGGSGATTLLRATAFRAARAGYPTLILRPEQVDIDLEDLSSFATNLADAEQAAKIADPLPLVIVLDIEHVAMIRARHLPRTLAARGRRALILQAIPRQEDDENELRGGQRIRLRPLHAEVTPGEVTSCAETLQSLIQRWNLPLAIPDSDEWNAYERATRLREPGQKANGGEPGLSNTGASRFWVALRYFLTDRLGQQGLAEDILNPLGRWVAKRAGKISDPNSLTVINYVAALSLLRLVSPFWTVLRPVTGGSFSSDMAKDLTEVGDIVEWGDYSPLLQDHILYFPHPALAEEYLRQQDASTRFEGQIDHLRPLLVGLSDGHPGDVWVAESLAAAIVPVYSERQSANWDWTLEIFETLPKYLCENSKTILHHWARCLYLSVDGDKQTRTLEDREKRYSEAIAKLKMAVSLPRRPDHDEHPSHLFNTLGTAAFRKAQFLQQNNSDESKIREAWEEAHRAFEQALSLSRETNIDALIAFSDRLLRHASWKRNQPGYESKRIAEIARALTLLDTAEDLLAQDEFFDEQLHAHQAELRMNALRLLDDSAAESFIESLKLSEPDLGYYCQARLYLGVGAGDDGTRQALDILDKAENQGIVLGIRSNTLRLSLLLKNPQGRYDFTRLRHLYQVIERNPNYTATALDTFRHAVVCYQVGDYREGENKFRRLREWSRQSGIAPLRIRDYWRDQIDSGQPHIAEIRVTRVLTEWRAEGEVPQLGQQRIPLRPRHFSPMPKVNDIVRCAIRFEFNGPLAVPERFLRPSSSARAER